MGVDLRQVVAGILTITMFVMLGQMLHRDYFDSLQVRSLPTRFSNLFALLELTSSGLCSVSLLPCQLVFCLLHFLC